MSTESRRTPVCCSCCSKANRTRFGSSDAGTGGTSWRRSSRRRTRRGRRPTRRRCPPKSWLASAGAVCPSSGLSTDDAWDDGRVAPPPPPPPRARAPRGPRPNAPCGARGGPPPPLLPSGSSARRADRLGRSTHPHRLGIVRALRRPRGVRSGPSTRARGGVGGPASAPRRDGHQAPHPDHQPPRPEPGDQRFDHDADGDRVGGAGSGNCSAPVAVPTPPNSVTVR